MSYLLAISIGPVQDFIAAARRTDDLYAGSQLISEITWETAVSIATSGTLLFPTLPGEGPTPITGNKKAGVGANKILAVISASDAREVREIVKSAEAAAKCCLRRHWDASCQILKNYDIEPDGNIAEQQLCTFIEFFAAWCRWDDADTSYQQARADVDRALAARKCLRDFKQPQKHNAVKSSLDPSRDTVTTRIPDAKRETRPLRLKKNENLDAVSVIKRVLPGTDAPSTADLAAESFLAARSNVRTILENIAAHNGLNYKTLRRAIYPGIRQEMVLQLDLQEPDASLIGDAVGRSDPNPYFAILLADGDGIGEALGELKTPQQHIDFSQSLARFASKAGELVNGQRGHCVYSGGDDVLAFLPVDTCIQCAAQLAKEFAVDTGRTLSVGIAIVHYHEPLYASLDLARSVEKLAKNKAAAAGQQGNRLAVKLFSRSGEARSAVWDWRDGFDLASWRRWSEAFANGLTRGLAYEWERLANEMEGARIPQDVLIAEAVRVYKRKRSSAQASADAAQISEEWVRKQLEDVCSAPAGANSSADSDPACGLMELGRQLMVLQRLSEMNVVLEGA